MNIYERKSRWKFWLALFAALIVVASLWYTSVLAGKIAENERNQVRIWAEAVEERATMVEDATHTFERLAEEERNRVRLWARALQRILTGNDAEVDPFVYEFWTSDKDIPRIWTSAEYRVKGLKEVDTTSFQEGEVLSQTRIDSFTQYDPIPMRVGNDTDLIYYQDSRIFQQIKDQINDIVENFISEVVLNSASVPVVYADSLDNVLDYGNIDTAKMNKPDFWEDKIAEMRAQNEPIEIEIGDGETHYIYYQDSDLLRQITRYPYIQFAIIALFVIVAYYLFSTARKAEQNLVWVGMSKETAHQLGTPISSLVGWLEILKDSDVDPKILAEIEKDTNRLELITERFSKIGSVPKLEPVDIGEHMRQSLDYLRSRTSKQVAYTLHGETEGIVADINAPLFDWVVENLVKNALDAMEGRGSITVGIEKQASKIIIDVTDSGKGIPKSKFKQVFHPGFSTKKRGWGLGLSLTKRIIENYHKGKIFVKQSVVGEGTTFRIVLPG